MSKLCYDFAEIPKVGVPLIANSGLRKNLRTDSVEEISGLAISGLRNK